MIEPTWSTVAWAAVLAALAFGGLGYLAGRADGAVSELRRIGQEWRP